ncbi:uncharacterized protein LOC114302282 [Camellia sinensis]|uniref:uncharacterized protein LOC114302282 n=1 Tax=Camellia sinensis TaxID=4442 RepID=UPI001035AA24|nr:uncharacterized protein LOC114302282 [Camellia sinensis]
MDLGCTGPRLAWTNNRQGWANTMVRLDRAICNTEWRTTFPKGLVQNLPRTYSDHSPMMIFTQGKSPFNPSPKSFKFIAAWILHEDFLSVMESNWEHSPPSLVDKLENLALNASVWNINKETFGNIFRNKRWLLGRIEGIQKSQIHNYSHNLYLLEMNLLNNVIKSSTKRNYYGFRNLGPTGLPRGTEIPSSFISLP